MMTRIARSRPRWGHRTLLAALVILATETAAAAGLDDVRAMIQQSRYAEALVQVEQYLRRFPRDPQARFLKGVALAEQARLGPAIEVFEALTTEYPELPEPHNNLAVLYAAHGEYENARDSLLVAIRADPEYATAHENLGDVYAQMASIAYGRSIEILAANPSAQSKLAALRSMFPEPTARPREPDDALVTPAAAVAEPSADELFAAAVPPLVAPPGGDGREGESGHADRGQAVLDVVRAWVRAWSNQDVAAYLALYGDGFEPPHGMSRHRWESQRRQRLHEPEFIRVELSDVEVQWSDDHRASVVFVQHYRSNTFEDQMRKRLLLARSGDTWKIVGERSDR